MFFWGEVIEDLTHLGSEMEIVDPRNRSVPTIIGIIVFLIAAQSLLKREHLWLPEFLLKRSVAQDKLSKALQQMKPAARFVDRLLRPRLTILTHGAGTYVIAALCLGIAATMPVMEMVPFSAQPSAFQRSSSDFP